MPAYPGSRDVINVTVRGADRVADGFRRASVAVPQESARATRMHTQLLVVRVKQHASGRPGPRTPTGDYRRSINGVTEQHGPVIIGIVGTTRPQGPRLERGFIGIDALGRHYNQPPFPHFQPASVEIETSFYASHEAIIRRI